MSNLDIPEITSIRESVGGIDRTIIDNLQSTSQSECNQVDPYDGSVRSQISSTFDSEPGNIGSLLRDEDPFSGSPEKTDPNLSCQIEDKLSCVEFYRNNTTLSCENPGLIWDCHCRVPEGPIPTKFSGSGSNYDCPFHDTDAGEHVVATPDDGVLEYRYDGVRVFHYASDHLFPLSVDAIVMYENLKSAGILDRQIESVVDVGCGVGFVPIALAVNSSSINRIGLIDIVLNPLLASKWNCIANQANGTAFSHDHYLNVGVDGIPTLGEDGTPFPAEVLVSNPPYLPPPPSPDQKPDIRIFDGFQLLDQLVNKGPTLADSAYINISSLAEPDIRRLADDYGRTVTRVGDSVSVPFAVTPALDDPNYISKLRDRGLDRHENDRYPFWHDIRTFEIS